MKTKTNVKSKTYQAIEKNIYKVGKSYRVRVNGLSQYCPTITQARKVRKTLKTLTEPVY
jgi:DNA-binding XRE family transcriptional regulator